MTDKSLEYYIDCYQRGIITAEEAIVLRELIGRAETQDELDRIMDMQLHQWEQAGVKFPHVVIRVQHALSEEINRPDSNDRPTRRLWLLRTVWLRYAAAILILLGVGAYLWNSNRIERSIVQHEKPVPVKNDVLPGSNRATLILSDGRKIILDEAVNGQLAQDGGADVVKSSDGKIEYNTSSTLSQPIVYNTLNTPRGGQYQLVLPDGSKVWLNAASSITYPTVFANDTRQVIITGEAYFEVQSNKEKPFIVKTPNESIAVLGTSFNVNAYADEIAIKTSLIEGAIKIGDKILIPGQAFMSGKIIETNVEQDVAWKNGYFNFEGANLPAVMRQLARWYDIKVIYKGIVKEETFSGQLPRNLTLSDVLEILRDVNIQYRIEGRTLFIE